MIWKDFFCVLGKGEMQPLKIICFLDFYMAVDAYCIPTMLCYLDVTLTPERSIEPHHRKF